jgi:glycerol uptake facilitator protein
MIVVLIGTSVVASAVTTGAQQGLWQVAVVWGWAVTLAIFIVGPISGAHLNPAVSLCLVLFRSRDFSWRILLHYVPAQLFGAFVGSLIVYGVWASSIRGFEGRNNITRGASGSELSCMMFGEYFPNPALRGAVGEVSSGLAVGVEILGTFFIIVTILSITDKRNMAYRTAIMNGMAPFWIGASVACAISAFAPLTQGGFNPARDFAPRIVAAIFGWGAVAIPATVFWVYIVGPLAGALVAGATYKWTLGRHYKEKCVKGECECTGG